MAVVEMAIPSCRVVASFISRRIHILENYFLLDIDTIS